MADLSCLRVTAAGCELLVQVVPNASRSGCVGLHDGALRLRVSAPAIDGRANAALLRWLASSLQLPRRAVRLVAGDSARRKRVELEVPVDRVATWVREQIELAGRAS